MGSIDTDPASNDEANKTIQSLIYYTEQNSGLDKQWVGNVWLNPPYGRGLAEPFITTLIGQYRASVTQAVVLTNGVYDTKWWSNLGKHCSALCLPDHRIAFINPETGKSERGNDKNQIFTYLGYNPKKFCEEFQQYGLCVIPARGDIKNESI